MHPRHGDAEATGQEARSEPDSHRASTLPAPYSPRVAGYAAGPFLDPQLITPSTWRWLNTRTYVVKHTDGHEYRALLVTSDGVEVGYWAVERLGEPLTDRAS